MYFDRVMHKTNIESKIDILTMLNNKWLLKWESTTLYVNDIKLYDVILYHWFISLEVNIVINTYCFKYTKNYNENTFLWSLFHHQFLWEFEKYWNYKCTFYYTYILNKSQVKYRIEIGLIKQWQLQTRYNLFFDIHCIMPLPLMEYSLDQINTYFL